MDKLHLKAIGLLMAVIMLISLAACGGNNASTDETSSGDSTSDESTDEETVEPAEPKEEEPVTLKYWTAEGSKGTSGVHDNPIMNEITKRTGVIIDFEFNVTSDKYNAMLASGDLPDLMTVWIKDLKPLVDGNHVIDLEPLLPEHGKSLMSETPQKLTYSKMFLSQGTNKLYFIPTWDIGEDWKPIKSFSNGPGIGMYIRWDYYKELGYPPLKNDLLDIIPILKEMQARHPVNEEGKKVYGFSPWFGDWDLWNFTIYYQGYDSVFAEAPKFVDIDFKNNVTITSQIGNTESTLWKGARLYNKAYQAGILDPDSLVQKYDQAVEKQNAGRVLANPVSWSVAGANAAFIQNGHPEQGFMAVKFPDNVTMASNLPKTPYADRWVQCITTKCKYPEKAMDLIDFLNSSDGMRLLLNGIENVHWKVDSDGIPRLTPETLDMLKGNKPDELELEGFGAYTHIYGRSDQYWDKKYNCYGSFINNESPAKQMESATPYQKDYCEHYGVSYPDELFEKTLPDNSIIFDGSFINMIEQPPTEIKQIDDKLLNYLKMQMVKIVTAKTDEEFANMQQQIIEECKNMGYETSFEWYKNQYEAAKGKVNEFYKAIGK